MVFQGSFGLQASLLALLRPTTTSAAIFDAANIATFLFSTEMLICNNEILACIAVLPTVDLVSVCIIILPIKISSSNTLKSHAIILVSSKGQVGTAMIKRSDQSLWPELKVLPVW